MRIYMHVGVRLHSVKVCVGMFACVYALIRLHSVKEYVCVQLDFVMSRSECMCHLY